MAIYYITIKPNYLQSYTLIYFQQKWGQAREGKPDKRAFPVSW